jgi:acyl-CoA thioesterase
MSEPVDMNESLEYARNTVACDPYATFLGIELEEVKPAYARLRLKVRPEFCNAVDRAHGALVYAMADQAFAVSCNSCGQRAMALTVTIHYHAGAPIGSVLISEGRPIVQRRKISLWELTVKLEDGTLIATAEGTAYHK